IHKLTFKLIHSTTKLLLAWQKILQEMKLKVTNMLRDVPTQWNSTYDMLEYALNHHEVVNSMSQNRVLGVRKFELDNREWILKDATLYFLHSTPNLTTVIPAMD
ncbi:hypothetical protein PAXRUDRAFT_42608, partial [Paxillus rubicundulus Ve08.2h10]